MIGKKIFTPQESKQFLIFAAGSRWTWFGLLVLVCMFLLCRCLLEDAGKRDFCGLNGCVADICAVYACAVGNMDVKSVDTLNYLLLHLRLRSPTFRPPLRLKFSFSVCFFYLVSPRCTLDGRRRPSGLSRLSPWIVATFF